MRHALPILLMLMLAVPAIYIIAEGFLELSNKTSLLPPLTPGQHGLKHAPIMHSRQGFCKVEGLNG